MKPSVWQLVQDYCLDLGTPTDGPQYGRILLWVAYFSAPIWTASAVFETILPALRAPGFQGEVKIAAGMYRVLQDAL